MYSCSYSATDVTISIAVRDKIVKGMDHYNRQNVTGDVWEISPRPGITLFSPVLLGSLIARVEYSIGNSTVLQETYVHY
jgi:hypothetical protein